MPSDLTPPDYISEPPAEGVLVIPYERLSEEALAGIIEEFISREGTDYGDYHYSFADKKAQVLSQLATKKALILFDPIDQSCHIELQAKVASYLKY